MSEYNVTNMCACETTAFSCDFFVKRASSHKIDEKHHN